MVREGERVLAAVSGGADSVAMLCLLRAEAEKGRIRLFAAHYEHGIRGETSRRDAAFVESLCARFGVPFSMGHGDVPKMARVQGMGVEEAAREARYEFLRAEKRRVGADCIAVAHHMDDQAETVLMHLLRGASLRGVRGMQVRSGDLYRPLLGVAKAEILEYLASIGQPYCVDETNDVCDAPRNLLRNQAMPILEAAYPGAVRAICRFSRMAGRDEEFLSGLAEQIERVQAPFGWILRLGDAPDALSSRVLAKIMPESRMIEAAQALKSGQRIQIQGMNLARRGEDLYVMEKCFAPVGVDLAIPGETEIPGVCRICAQGSSGGPIRDDLWRQRVSLAALEGCDARVRQEGDWIRPLGMRGRKLLSDYFTDRKIPRELRDYWPLVCRGAEVIWVPGVGVSESARLAEGPGVEITCKTEAWLAFAADIRKEK